MGQRARSTRTTEVRAEDGKKLMRSAAAKLPDLAERPLVLAVFSTELGWFAAVGHDKVLEFLTVGHPSAASARAEALKCIQKWVLGTLDEERDWCPKLERRLQDYAAGKQVRFDDIPLALPSLTAFQSSVLKQTRKIGFGKTLSYGELALKVGFPRAARGVGTVMSHNRFPVIIPCHRVVASQGKLGGYSSPQGICLKQRLLDLEAGGLD